MKGCDYTGEERRKSCSLAEAAAEAAAKKATEQTFAIAFGVDVNDPAQVRKLQRTQNFAETLSVLFNKGLTVTVITLAALAVAVFGAGIKTKVLEWFK